MKKLILTSLTVVMCLTVLPDLAQAQMRGADYETSAGLRLSGWYGVSVKHFIQGTNAVEGILHSSWDGLKITGLYEMHTQAFDEPGLKFYYGGGAHLGFVGGRYINYRNDDYFRSYGGGSSVLLGVDGIVGIEYTIRDKNVPLNVSLDWKPVVDFSPWVGFWGAEIGLSVRYIFR